MSTNAQFVRRRIAACAAAALILPALAACGADLDPPAQNINRNQVDKKTQVPGHASGNRKDFGDEYGKRAAPKAKPTPKRSLNRMDFRDDGL